MITLNHQIINSLVAVDSFAFILIVALSFYSIEIIDFSKILKKNNPRKAMLFYIVFAFIISALLFTFYLYFKNLYFKF